jgi:CRISPR-associated protein Cas2
LLVLLFYDIRDDQKPLYRKVKKVAEKFLYRVQFSVFEGELSESRFQKLLGELEKLFQKVNENSVLIYTFHNPNSPNKIIFGEKREDLFFT